MSRMRLAAGFCALVLTTAACGDFTSSGDPLSEAEAAELAEVFAEEGFAGFGGVPSSAQSPGANDEAAARITITINETGSCEGSGTVAISGSLTADVDQQAGTGTLEYSYTITPANCRVQTESNKVFTISGDPNLKVSGSMSLTETSIKGKLKYEGKFTWSEGTRSGACGVNLEASYDFTFGGTTINGSASLTGSVCGSTVNRTIEVQDIV